jgi:hypothetical protein
MMKDTVEMQIEGPSVDEETGTQTYVVHGEDCDVHFSVIPETRPNNRTEWGVQIEGVAGPGIVHDEPWLSSEVARDAALEVVQDMLVLERMQREELERAQYKQSDEAKEQEPCEGETGTMR